MTAPMSFPLVGFEQILLLLFVLMVLVGIAGGNPSMVLKPLFEIAGHLLMTLISLLGSLPIALIRVAGSVLSSGIKLSAETLRSGSVTQNKR